MLKRFLTKGTITAVMSLLAVVFGGSNISPLFEWLQSPDTLDRIMQLLGLIGLLSSGFMQGVKPKEAPAATTADPYPGYKYDAIKGWVKVD